MHDPSLVLSGGHTERVAMLKRGKELADKYWGKLEAVSYLLAALVAYDVSLTFPVLLV